jgi:hypothetical protein
LISARLPTPAPHHLCVHRCDIPPTLAPTPRPGRRRGRGRSRGCQGPRGPKPGGKRFRNVGVYAGRSHLLAQERLLSAGWCDSRGGWARGRIVAVGSIHQEEISFTLPGYCGWTFGMSESPTSLWDGFWSGFLCSILDTNFVGCVFFPALG